MIAILLTVLALTQAAAVDRVELISCQQDKYNSTTKICMQGVDHRSKEPELMELTSYMDIFDQYDTCDKESTKDYYCNRTMVNLPNGDRTVNGVCVMKRDNGAVCVEHFQCKTTFCIPTAPKAATRACAAALSKEGGACSTSRDCDRDFACSISLGTCQKRTAEGATCSDVACQFDYMCDFATSKCMKLFSVVDLQPASFSFFCKTGHLFPNGTCEPYDALPLLQLNKSQFIKCGTDDDCVYYDNAGKLADVGEERCFYASLTEKEEKYCRFGGGEDKLVQSMKEFIDTFTSEDEFEIIAHTILVNPIARLDLINPGNCTLFDEIKQKYGAGESVLATAVIALLALLI
jgi:hypothetical protein